MTNPITNSSLVSNHLTRDSIKKTQLNNIIRILGLAKRNSRVLTYLRIWTLLEKPPIVQPLKKKLQGKLFILKLSLVCWGAVLQTGRSRDRVQMRWIFLNNLPNPSSLTMALGSTQSLTEMSTRNLPGRREKYLKIAGYLTPFFSRPTRSTELYPPQIYASETVIFQDHTVLRILVRSGLLYLWLYSPLYFWTLAVFSVSWSMHNR
jgi:hypothetical protein